MNKYVKIVLYGLLMWIVPFFAGFFFVDRSGSMLIDETIFKSIMILLSGALGAFLLIMYFRSIKKDYLKDSIVLGLIWLGINWVLDLIILLPMTGMGIGAYFGEIGIRYLMAPFMSIAIGFVKEK